MSRGLGVVVGGTSLGFVLSRTGFTDWGQVHSMFTFSDLRLIGVFGVAVVVVAIGMRWLPLDQTLPQRRFHKGLVPAAALFGLGWALSGACPGAVLAMVGEGQATALIALMGVVLGSALWRPLSAWATRS